MSQLEVDKVIPQSGTTLTLGESGDTVTIPSGATFTPTLTAPIIDEINDNNGNEEIIFTTTTSAVNELTIANAATGNAPEIAATGDDTDIDLKLTPKGAGNLVLDGIEFPNTDGTAGQALVTDGSGVLSFASLGAAAGQIIQVVTATDSTSRSSTSGTYVTASNTLSVSITPSSASNKVFILYTGAVQNAGVTNSTSHFTIFRGVTNLGGGGNSALGSIFIDANNLVSQMSIGYLDSPNTTSATTYQVQFKNDNNTTVYLNAQATLSSITAFEVKG
jgi:hypothetical protein